MSLKTVSYDTIKARVEARAGRITDDNKDYFDSLLNESIQYIFDETPFWPRYLRYEPRTVLRGYVQDEEDSLHVYGAGSGAVNGLYTVDSTSGYYQKKDGEGNILFEVRPSGGSLFAYGFGREEVNTEYVQGPDVNGRPSYIAGTIGNLVEIEWNGFRWEVFIETLGTEYLYRSSDNVATPDLVTTWEAVDPADEPVGAMIISEWQISAISYVTSDGEFVTSDGDYVYVPGQIVYVNDTVSTTPPESGWFNLTGEDPAPIVQALGKIEQIIEQDPTDRWSNPVRKQKTYREFNGNRSTDLTNGTAWVAYKHQLDGIFGDGTGGTIDEIPREFSRYVALDVAYSLQEQARRSNPNGTYTASYSQVSDAMNIALINVNRENAMNAIRSQGNTYFNQDYSTR